MALELVYTSATRGLRAGTSGFCTVAMTKGFPPALVARLEALGGYRAGPSGDGPVAFCFWRVETATGITHVLSVVGPAPPDHTARTNKIATYLVLSPNELVRAGPAWLLSQPGLLRRTWSGEPAWIDASVRVPPSPDAAPAPCTAWAEQAGDAGWAGVVASTFLRDQSKPIHVICGAGTDPLPLVDEVLRLLPDWARWRCTFSTYFLQPVAGTPCALRFCLEGTAAADAARQSKGLVIDLVRSPGSAPDSRFARLARTGIDESPAVARPGSARGRHDGEIDLSPDEGTSEPVGRAFIPRPRASSEPASPVTVAAPVKPAVIALVAAGLTLLALVIVIVVLTRGGGAARPPVEEPAHATEGEGGGNRTPATDGHPGPGTESPAQSLGTAPAPTPEGPGADAPRAPSPAAGTPDPAPTPKATVASDPASRRQAAAPAPASKAAGPAASPVTVDPASPGPAASPSTIAPAMLPTAVLRIDSTDAGLRGGTDVGVAGVRSLRFRVPASLASVLSVGTSGDLLDVGATKARVTVHLEGTRCVLSAPLTGPGARDLPAALGEPTASPSAALQHALERCAVEAIDAGGAMLARVQFRPWASVAVAPAPATHPATKVPDLGSDVLFVQLLPPSGIPTPAIERVGRRDRRTVTVGAWLLLTVDRTVDAAAAIVRAQPQDPTAIVARRTELSSEINALNSAIAACRAFDAAAAAGTTVDDVQLKTIDDAMTTEERAEHLGAPDAAFGKAAPAARLSASAAMKRRMLARLDGASSELRQANDAMSAGGGKGAAAARWKLRIMNEDGLVLHEGPVNAVGGGK